MFYHHEDPNFDATPNDTEASTDPTTEFAILFCLSAVIQDAVDFPTINIGEQMDHLDPYKETSMYEEVLTAFEQFQEIIHKRMSEIVKEESSE